MTSQPIRDPLADHLITPQNSAFLLIDWQPTQISTVNSMDRDLLLRNAVSTAPMGGPQDPWAVVDSKGAVKGIGGLRVVDASIMPVVVSVALNPTTIMIAERIAKAVYGTDPGPIPRSVQVAPTA